jgi:N-acetylmuramoyl-L-alanine amidase
MIRPERIGIAVLVIALAAGIATATAQPLSRGAVRRLSRAGVAAVPSGGRAVDARLFQPSSCIAFRPIHGHRRRTVFIDAGHGGPDPGGVGTTLTGRPVAEAPINLLVALDALHLLRRHGFRVVLSRTGPADAARPLPGDLADGAFTAQGRLRDLAARNECSDLAHADVVLGIDFDAAASPALGGSLTLFDALRPYAAENLRLADLVQRDVLASLARHGDTVPDDGVHTDGGYGSGLTAADRAYGHLVLLGPGKSGYLATPTMAPAALIEPLFLTDPAEATLATTTLAQHAIAGGLATAVYQYFTIGLASEARA